MQVLQGVPIELDPTPSQREIFDRHMVAAADAYNMALELDDQFRSAIPLTEEPKFQKDGKAKMIYLGDNERARLCTSFRNKLHKDYFGRFDSIAIHGAVDNYKQARQNVFKSSAGFPNRKKPFENESFCIKGSLTQGTAKFIEDGWAMQVSGKLGNTVKFRQRSRFPDAPIKRAYIKRRANRYWVSCLVEAEPAGKVGDPTEIIAGIDMGMQKHALALERDVVVPWGRKLKKIAVYWDGKIAKFQRNLRKKQCGQLPPTQAKLDRMVKGSKRYKKAMRRKEAFKTRRVSNNARREYAKLKTLYLHRRHAMKDCLEKMTTELVNKIGVLAIQHDRYSAMMTKKKSSDGKKRKPPQLGKSILQMQPHRTILRLKQKCEWYARKYYGIEFNVPTTKVCLECGFKNSAEDTHVSNKVITCAGCGRKYGRDDNAAAVIREEGIKRLWAEK